MGSNSSAPANGQTENNITGRSESTQPHQAKKRNAVVPNQTTEADIPKVVPPTVSREELLSDIDFNFIDQHALQAPNELLIKSFWELTKYLTDDDAWGDMAKIRAIFRWITSYNIKHMKIQFTPPADTPLEYFSKIQCDMGNHAFLVYILCQIVDIPCVVIDGMAKSKMYKVGEPINRDEMAAQWNAVYIDDEWRLLDLFWATTCVKVDSGQKDLYDEFENEIEEEEIEEDRYIDDDEYEEILTKQSIAKYVHKEEVDDQYFFTDPKQLIWTHFPDDPKWQLLKTPMAEKEWGDQVYVRERTHELGIKIQRRKYGKCVIDAKEGKADIVLWLPEDRGETYDFKHSFRRMGAEKSRRGIDKILHRFTIFEQLHDRVHFKCVLPVSGKFVLDIYGRDSNDIELIEFDLLCSYLLISTTPDKEPKPLPDYPKIGWGPCTKTKQAGVRPITHKQADIVTDSGLLEIRLEGRKELMLRMKLKSPLIDDANLSKYALLRWNSGQYIIDTRFPKPGRYALKLYAFVDGTSKESVNVLNYLITCTNNVHNTAFPNISQWNLGEDPNIHKLWIRSCFQSENGHIEAHEGHAKLEFQACDSVVVLCELHSNDPDAAQRMRVINKEEKNKQCFYLDLPVRGEYSFNVFGYKRTTPSKLHNAFAYLVHSSGRPIEVGNLNTTKGNANKNFWRDCHEVNTETIDTKEDEIAVPVPRGIQNLAAYMQKKGSSESPSSKPIQLINEQGIDLYKVQISGVGEYLLNIFERKDIGFIKCKARYLIRKMDAGDLEDKDFREVMDIIREERKREGKDVTEADKLKRQMNEAKGGKIKVNERIFLTQQLQVAIDSQNPAQLRKALADYQYIKPGPKDDLLVRASKLLKKVEARNALLEAYENQDLAELEKALVKANAVDQDGSMKQEVNLAKRLYDRLAAMTNLRDMALNTDVKTITELRKLGKPPDGVHQAIMAALLLLDHPKEEIDQWKKCLALLGKRDQDSLRHKMANISPDEINRKKALEAKQIIEPYTEQKLRYISPGAAAFFIWTKQMIKEIEAMSGTLMPKKKVIEKSPTPPPPTPPPPTPPSPRKQKKKRGEKEVKQITLRNLKDPIPVEPPKETITKTPRGAMDTPRDDGPSYTSRFHKMNNWLESKKKNNPNRPNSDTPVVKLSPGDNKRQSNSKPDASFKSPRQDLNKSPQKETATNIAKNPHKQDKAGETKNEAKKPNGDISKPQPKPVLIDVTKNKKDKKGDKTNRENEAPNSTKDKVKNNSKNKQNDGKKELDNGGYYAIYKSEKDGKPKPDILEVNHDDVNDPDDDITNSKGGYASLFMRRKYFKEHKTMPKAPG